MIIFGVILLVIIIGVLFYNLDREEPGFIFIAVGAFIFIFVTLACVCNHYEVHGAIQEIKAIEATINNARKRDNLLESAAFQIKIAEANQKIASWKYYNNTIFDVFIPEVVETLEPIK